MSRASSERSPERRTIARTGAAALTVGALGVVFGDIGTSPLYAIQAVFTASDHPVPITQPNVYGIISLVFWSITMIVTVKYVGFIMRADNEGEGGIMALTALLQGAKLNRRYATLTATLVTLGILGASLFYGDGVITPAISVLSAVAGLKVAVPSLGSLVLPITVAVLCALFAIQQFGTGVVGNLFGPVMAVWFTVIGGFGLLEVVHHPDIIKALSPSYGAQFFYDEPVTAFFALGAVVLAVTGAEALYADMGHFGRGAIRRAWFFIVFPALTLNYLGQGSLILRIHADRTNPFYLMLPSSAQIPMVFLATFATVIASQAVISGAFSLSQQAVQLGFLPPLTIRHTSSRQVGQIYVPVINAIMFAAVVAIVVAFGSANALANAYGIAVTGTFVLTTILFLSISRLLWHKRKSVIVLGAVVFLLIDVAFFSSNMTKIVSGGWLPLALAVCVFTILTTWRSGQRIVTANRARSEGPLGDFVEELAVREIAFRTVPGVSVFLTPDIDATPLALRANVAQNHALHDKIIIVSVETERVPHVPNEERIALAPALMFSGATGDPIEIAIDRLTRLTVRFGFNDTPDVPAALRLAAEQLLIGAEIELEDASYFLSQISIVPTGEPSMRSWRKKLFVTMSRNAANPAGYYNLPDDRTVLVGSRVEL
ncbi:MAG: potassium transporter Kup [Solirubrobacteraceae bacterium]